MLRRRFGWRRIDDEDWHDIMMRMNQRLEHARSIYSFNDWSTRFAKNQWSYVVHFLRLDRTCWARHMAAFIWDGGDDRFGQSVPRRRQGRPRLRWDSNIQAFFASRLPHKQDEHWIEVLTSKYVEDIIEDYVEFICALEG